MPEDLTPRGARPAFVRMAQAIWAAAEQSDAITDAHRGEITDWSRRVMRRYQGVLPPAREIESVTAALPA